jgi:hypothetical protein
MAETPAWKDDFPISWVDDNFVTRREFTKSLVLVSCATFCANGALVARAALERRAGPEKMEPLRIGGLQDLPVGASRVFEYPRKGEPCLLIRLDADRFVAFAQKCTHLGCPVLYRTAAAAAAAGGAGEAGRRTLGAGDPAMTPSRRMRSERAQQMTAIYAVMVAILILILIQFLLLMIALEDYLSGQRTLLSGAALGSGLCFAASWWLIRYLSARRSS